MTKIVDGMVILQQMEKVSLSSFGNVSEYLLRKIMSDQSKTVYFVTDQYTDGSIKSYERARRSLAGSMRYRVERRDQLRPKQWSKFLKDSNNKTELIHFFLKDWSHQTRYLGMFTGRNLYVNVESKFYKLSIVNNQVSYPLSIIRYLLVSVSSSLYLKGLWNTKTRQIPFYAK